jgi:glycosyltransferase involved in cell wall biosynthesis
VSPRSRTLDVKRSQSTSSADRVDVSVVVASRARRALLERCLEALCDQTLPRDRFEVVVCDDESPEPLAPLVDGFSDRLALTIVRQRHAGPAAARNEGARHASGPLLAFTDDDCVPDEHWLELLLGRANRHPGHLIGGSNVNVIPDDPYATATQLIMSCVYDYYARHDTGHRFFSTTNLSAPSSRFWVLGGFSERYPRAAGEDYDFCARWHEAGFPDVYAPEVEVGHAHPHTLASFWQQHFGYGRALLRVREGMARRRGQMGIELESPSFYREILTYPLRQGHGLRALQYEALVLLSQLATATGALWEWKISPDPSFGLPEPQTAVPVADVERPTPRSNGEHRVGGSGRSSPSGGTRAPHVGDAHPLPRPRQRP